MSLYPKLVLALAVLSVSQAPAAATTVVDSNAYGLSFDLTLGRFAEVGILPAAAVGSSTTGPAYHFTGTVASLAATNYLLGTVGSGPLSLSSNLGIGTGLINTAANGGPLPASQTANASASVDNLALSLSTLSGLGVNLPFLSLGAGTISSRSSVAGTPFASATGSSDIENLRLSIAGVPIIIGANVFAAAAPNTDLLGFLHLNAITGLDIIINEQVKTGDNVANAAISTNALHLIFDNYAIGSRLLSGNIIVSHSYAQIIDATSETPEPATWMTMITGFGLIGAAARRRRPVTSAA